jgi:17beta-estradiol 17-dehydrogenase / very-long-chain 3-oxoacyl-CoA reductase
MGIGSAAFDWLAAWAWWFVGSYLTFRLMKFLYIVSRSIYGHFFSTPLDLGPYLDSWTVVTGCTDGIGRAYVDELARARGVRKFYLIGRSLAKLERVKKEMEEKYGCEIKTATFDFEHDEYNDLPSELQELPVGILINCAGIAPERVANFAELPVGLPSKILRVNLMSNVKMTELILPGMLKRNQGIIVNIASVTGWRPLPYMSTYPASKAAISFFSDALYDEFTLWGRTNIRIQCLIPLLVATKIASYEASEANDIWVVDVRTFARQAVNIIGNYRISTGCFLHDMQIAFGQLISFWFFKQLFVPFVLLGIHRKRVDRYQESLRKKALD